MAYTQEQIDKIIELREQGKGVTEIGRILGLDRRHVSKHLKQLGYSTDRNPIDKNIFSVIDTEEKAYWLGFLYADGYVNKIQGQVAVALQERDLAHLEKLKAFLKCNNKISYSEATHSYKLSFCCNQITKDLIKLGCLPCKSLILEFPTEEQVPSHLKRHFMRGYVDGDGCLCTTDKTYCFSFTSTENFINKAIEFFKWKPCKLDSAGQARTWRCADKTLVPQYLHLLYKNSIIYLERKYEKYLLMTS